MSLKPAFLAKFLLFEGGPQERKKSAHVDIYSRLIVLKGDKIAVNQLREITLKINSGSKKEMRRKKSGKWIFGARGKIGSLLV